ncbi:lectin-like domain-containing protein [Sorangium sp. So ce1000]|uniref:lectin-like domain-containing protein n=1 Tax=Sorangium sp. So ce1000 TaxID=3133325 RepID=UPI003F6061A1
MQPSQPIRASRAATSCGRRAPAKALFLLPTLAAAVSMCGGRSDILEDAVTEEPGPAGPGPEGPGPEGPGPEGPGPGCVPTPETCDGLDNDCDGIVDEGCSCTEGQERSCYSGPPGTQGVGACKAGVQVCSRNVWGPCTGEGTPVPEACDLVDNDCDGQIDESTCPGGTACGVSIAADMRSPPEGWSFNGDAFWDADRLTGALTEAEHGQAGTIIYRTPIAADAFTATFEFRLGGGDGMGFMLQTTGETAVGEPGGGLGMAGLTGYGVEIDTYHNLDCSDSNSNHLGVDDLAQPCDAGVLGSLGQAATNIPLGNAAFHTAQIELNEGVASMSIDGKLQFRGFTIRGFPVGSKFFYGFAAGTGEATARQEIRNVKITFPSPRCL